MNKLDKKYVKILISEAVILAGMLTLDLITKKLAADFLVDKPGRSYEVIRNILLFTYSENTGAGFSMLSGNRRLLLVLTGVMCAGIIAYLVINKKDSRVLRTGILVLLSGALGNYSDRLFLGFVRDFIEVPLFNIESLNFYYPIFNVADIWILTGAITIGIYVVTHLKDNGRGTHRASVKDKAEKNE